MSNGLENTFGELDNTFGMSGNTFMQLGVRKNRATPAASGHFQIECSTIHCEKQKFWTELG